MQSSLAISGNGRDWHLVNASLDIARQIEHFIRPSVGSGAAARQSPIRSVFLTNADLDHTLGLFQLREGGQIDVTAPAAVRDSLERGLSLGRVLGAYGGIEWRLAHTDWRTIDDSGLEACAVPLTGGKPPRYALDAISGAQSVGYLFRGGGATVGIFPDVACIDAALTDSLAQCDRCWFDGTFWGEDEMATLTGRTAADMGHVPISGAEGSLTALGALGEQRAAYLHINNTNPILRTDSAERRAVETAGVRVAEDGEHFAF